MKAPLIVDEEVTLYSFSELSRRAKRVALLWYIQSCHDYYGIKFKTIRAARFHIYKNFREFDENGVNYF